MTPDRGDAARPDRGPADQHGPSDHIDLDRLIGELETEGARRRAAPDYPHDQDARIHVELERRAPHPRRGTDADAVVADLEAAVAALVEQLGAGPGRPPAVGGGRALAGRLRRLEHRAAAVGLAAVAAVRSLAERVAELEGRGPGAPGATPAGPADEAGPGDDGFGWWRRDIADALDGVRGRVLYADADADAVVAELRAAGVDAYGLTGEGDDAARPGPDVRTGAVLEHLRAVGDGGLGAVVLAGPPAAMAPEVVEPLAAELGRTTSVVVLVSPAPWWWRRQVGPVRADLAPRRPFGPDTWLETFDRRAMSGAATYDPDGRSYRLVVRRR